jgi:hypothetical protein
VLHGRKLLEASQGLKLAANLSLPLFRGHPFGSFHFSGSTGGALVQAAVCMPLVLPCSSWIPVLVRGLRETFAGRALCCVCERGPGGIFNVFESEEAPFAHSQSR